MPATKTSDAKVKSKFYSKNYWINLFISADPCESKPCKGKNTICVSKSALDFKCLCDENYLPINGSSRFYGCERKEKKKCGPNSNLMLSGSCLCRFGYFEVIFGDAETIKGCQSIRII